MEPLALDDRLEVDVDAYDRELEPASVCAPHRSSCAVQLIMSVLLMRASAGDERLRRTQPACLSVCRDQHARGFTGGAIAT